MKIAIASENKNLNSKVFDFAGRAPFYLVFEGNKLLEVIENPFLNQGGVGFKLPQLFDEKGIEFFIAGKFGKNIEENLQRKNIKFREFKGSIKDFLDE